VRPRLFPIISSTCLLLAACGPKAGITPAPVASQPVSIDSLAQKKDEPAPATTIGAPPAPSDTKENAGGIDPESKLPDSEAVYQATRKFAEKNRRQAKDLDELIATGFLPKLPAPPPGKKYLLNQRDASLRVVDK
jgi:hypothetical protein